MAQLKRLTDEEVRGMPKITPAIAARYLDGFPNPMSVCVAMRFGKLPIGIATQNERTGRWTYRISTERMIAYQHGKLPEADFAALETKLNEFIGLARETIDELRKESAMAQQ